MIVLFTIIWILSVLLSGIFLLLSISNFKKEIKFFNGWLIINFNWKINFELFLLFCIIQILSKIYLSNHLC